MTLIMRSEDYQRPFSIRLKKQPIETLLEAIKISMGDSTQIIQRNGYVFIGAPDDGDQVIDLFKLPGEASEYRTLFQAAAGGSTIAEVYKDHMLMRGTQQQIERARRLHQQILQRRRQYCIDVVFVELSEEQAQNAGIDITLSGAVELAIDGSKNMFTSGYDLGGVLQSVFSASGTQTNQAKWQSNRLFCVEGQSASMMIGDVIAIRRRVTTDNGFIEETDTQTFSAGTELTVTVFGVAQGLIKVDLEPEISFVREYLDGVPTISTRKLTSSAYCTPNAIIVLGGQDSQGQTVSGSTLPMTNIATNRNDHTSKGRTFIFLQIKEIPALDITKPKHQKKEQTSNDITTPHKSDVPASHAKETSQKRIQRGQRKTTAK